jgi:ApeA N-terminal domain 1/Apea-like HEPN
MESFEDDGVFWLPGKETEQRTGRIKFDPAEGGTLTVMGGFGDLPEQFQGQEQSRRIFGIAGKRYLTLDGCINSNSTFEMPGIPRQTYYVGQIIAGHLFPSDEPLTFDKCAVTLDQLPAWVRRSGVQVKFETQTPELVSPDRLIIEYNQLQDEIVQVDDEELRLTTTWALTGDQITSTSLNQDTVLEIKYPTAQPLQSILSDIKRLQDLLTLATTAPTVPVEIALWREDLTVEYKPDSYRPQAMTYYAGQLAERARQADPQSKARVLFQFQDIGGLATIARWIKVARAYHTVVGSLLSIRYAAGLYVENQFNNVISAAESFHRLRFPNEVMPEEKFEKFLGEILDDVRKSRRSWVRSRLKYANEPRLSDRLREMAAHVDTGFAALYDEPSSWVTVVTEVRNRLTHHDKDRAVNFQQGDLLFLTESVFALVMLCLFRECAMDDKALTAIAESDSMRFLRGKLIEIIPRLLVQVQRKQSPGT